MGNYTTKNVTSDLSFLMTLTQIYRVDDEGFVIDADSQERVVHKLDGDDVGKEIVVFQDTMPRGNYYFFNPFADSAGRQSPAAQLFYKLVRLSLVTNINMVIEHVANEVKKSKEDKSILPDPTILRMASVNVDKKTTVIDVVDDQFLQEISTLISRMGDSLLHIVYLPAKWVGYVKVDALTDPKWDEKYGDKIRKKSLLAYKALLMGVLDITKPEELSKYKVKYDDETKAPARLDTVMRIVMKLYRSFNEVLGETTAIDLERFQEVIESFPAAYAIAKHMLQPTLPKQSATDLKASDTSRYQVTQQTSAFGNPAQPQGQAGGKFKPHFRPNTHDPFALTPDPMQAPHPRNTLNPPAPNPFGTPSTFGTGFGAPVGFGATPSFNQAIGQAPQLNPHVPFTFGQPAFTVPFS